MRPLFQLIRRCLAIIAIVCTAMSVFWSGYMVALSRGAIRNRPRPRAGRFERDPDTFFRIIVPAHDEASDIARTLEALQALDYPPALFHVHVIADNCTDDTARVARSFGVTVHERREPQQRGKGAALLWLFRRLPPVEDGVFVVIDADCVAEPELLREFHRELDGPHDAVQGHTLIHGAGDGGALGFRAAAFAVRNYLRPLGRLGLGGSAFLFGTGMAIRESLIRSHAWSNELAEDLEFSARLILDGQTIGFARDAELTTIMPTSLDESQSQHERWTAGRNHVASTWVPELVSAAVRKRHGRRWTYLDAAIDLSMPALSLQVLTALAGVALAVVSTLGRLRLVLLAACVGSLGAIAGHVVHALRATNAPAGVYRSLAQAPRNLLWQARIFARTRTERPESWVRTPRQNTEAAVGS